MMKKVIRCTLFLSLLGFLGGANAGHLFTQAATNSPVVLTAGNGITIPQPALETYKPFESSINFLSDWGVGDSLRLTIGGTVTDILFQAGDSSSFLSRNLAYFNVSTPFDWRLDALTGGFTLAGYRLRTPGGNIDGTNSGLVNQSQVTVTPPPTNGVPAPAVLSLLGIGLLGMRFSLRRKA